MAQNTKNQSVGHAGEGRLQQMFKDQGYACSNINPDFGEDFFVFCQDGTYIEPFRIFVQSKASAEVDFYESDWTAYCDSMTVRNWVLNNELTIIARQNFQSGETRFSIPEDEVDYWSIDFSRRVPIHLSERLDSRRIEHLVWRARIRHYDRIVRLVRPNVFEPSDEAEVPVYRKFILEFLVRLHIFAPNFELSERTRQEYNYLFFLNALGMDFEAASDMTLHETLRYAACMQLVLRRLVEVSASNHSLSKPFADDCACLLIQFIIRHETNGDVVSVKDDAYYKNIRRNLLHRSSNSREWSPFLTEWHEASISPKLSGVYQRDYGDRLLFNNWNGEQWVDCCETFVEWESRDAGRQPLDLPWRGIAPMTAELELVIAGIAASIFAAEPGGKDA